MIKIENLAFSYGRKTVLEGITMDLLPGRIYGLLGENGVGKTTLLTLLAGLKKPKEGSISVDGTDPYGRTPDFLEELFYLPDEVAGFNESAESWAKEYGIFRSRFSMDRFAEIMNLFEVSLEQKMNKMSNGQLKKTHIAFGLACAPKFILMDEPTNGLDIPSKSVFRTALFKYTPEDSIVVISTHQVHDLENIIDPIIILDCNEVLLNASAEEISRKLFFDYGNTRRDDALYCEPTPSGLIQVAVNTEGLDSKVNIEALFNTVDKNKELVKSLFNHE